MGYLIVIACLLSCGAVQANWETDFAKIKDRSRSYEDSGAICEELARLKFEKKYDQEKYEVQVGIAYGDNLHTIGELDIVVFNRTDHQVETIAEVKCWKDLGAGLEKAKEQRTRFLTHARSSKEVYYRSTSSAETYAAQQFKNVKAFTSLGQRGSVQAGYDEELEYDLKELHRLRVEMIRCQSRGECSRPE